MDMAKPKIRFKGYTDEWEQRKLGDILILLKDGTHGTHHDTDSGPLLLSAKNIKNGTVQWDESDRRISKDEYENIHANFKLKDGDVLLTIVGSIGETAILKHSENVTFQRSVAFLRPSNELKSEFLYSEIQSSRFQKELNNRKSTSAQPGIYLGDLGEISIDFPKNEDEQYAVSQYFCNLDSLITLHQRKCEQAKKLKKYMLQKMFPQNGQKVPEIRFKGFTDDWEQRKLGEVCSRVQGNDGRMDLPTLTISAANGWMKQEDRFSGNIAGKEQKNYTLLHKGELSYNHGNSKLAKYGTVFSLQTYEEALVPRVYHSFKIEDGNADFLEYYFATKLPDRELGKLISSGARMDGLLNIGYDEFMGIQMVFPSIAEQNRVASYFRCLDTFITLHQQKCDELKNIKKFMLQNMFI